MIIEQHKLWSEHPYFDELTRQELLSITDPKEIEDRFYTDLEFGTGGLRGIIAAGTNRMNRYVIRKATQGLADYIIDFGNKKMEQGVVIAYDSRRYSKEFALEAALTLAKNNIKAYLFDELRPTPELSFAVRYLKAVAGIVITASHNPKEYNGYKVYWEDGGQIPLEPAEKILSKIKARKDWVDIEPLNIDEAFAKGLLLMIGSEIDNEYIKQVKELSLYPKMNALEGYKINIVYTPLHGTGNYPVRRVLTELGFTSLHTVTEQEHPDPDFPTVPYPNPEIPSTFDYAKRYGEIHNADILLATDPDADRLGVVIKNATGEYQQLTGNQIGVFLTYYILSQKLNLGILPEKAVIIKTIASTDLADYVAESFGVKVENVLTGFKFIAEKEKEMEEQGWGDFQFGFEESYGFLAGKFVRDKDAVIAAVLLCEAVLFYKLKEGLSITDILEKIYLQHGYYKEDQVSITLQGIEGKKRMAEIMDTLRTAPIKELGGLMVKCTDDYTLGISRQADGTEYKLDLPKSNVIRFSFAGGGFAMVRPSGTEPKIKLYFSVRSKDQDILETIQSKVKEDLLTYINPNV